MPRDHLVRIGVLGHVGRFSPADGTGYPRASRVICRTNRGLEVGEVLSIDGRHQSHQSADGSILRGVTVEDELLLTRLEKNRDDAYRACTESLAERGIAAMLMDVEHLFDGQAIYFYFLGDVTPEIDSITHDLAEVYESKVQIRKFTESLTDGCGPDCGTEAAEGCGTNCATCAVVAACHSSD